MPSDHNMCNINHQYLIFYQCTRLKKIIVVFHLAIDLFEHKFYRRDGHLFKSKLQCGDVSMINNA